MNAIKKFLSALLILTPATAFAHDDAEWIMNNPTTAHCCGPEDCEELQDGTVVQTKKGYRIILRHRTYHVPYGSPAVHPSINAKWWICVVHGDTMMEDDFKCLFAPAGG